MESNNESKRLFLSPMNEVWYKNVIDDYMGSLISNVSDDWINPEEFLTDLKTERHVRSSTPRRFVITNKSLGKSTGTSIPYHHESAKCFQDRKKKCTLSPYRTLSLDNNVNSKYVVDLRIPRAEFCFEPVFHAEFLGSQSYSLKKTFKDYAICRTKDWLDAALRISNSITPTAKWNEEGARYLLKKATILFSKDC